MYNGTSNKGVNVIENSINSLKCQFKKKQNFLYFLQIIKLTSVLILHLCSLVFMFRSGET